MGQPSVLSLPAAPCPKCQCGGCGTGSPPHVRAVGQGPSACGGGGGRVPPYVVTRYQEIMVTSSQWTCTMALCWAKSKGEAWTQAAPHPGLAL